MRRSRHFIRSKNPDEFYDSRCKPIITRSIEASWVLCGGARDCPRQRRLLFEPLPFITRVIFVATPHGGSYRALGMLGSLASWFVNLPGRVAKLSIDVAALRARGVLAKTYTGIPTAITNMNPSNPFLQTLHSLPIVESVKAHSIIAVQGNGKPEEGADGIVMYKSAHIEGVISEKSCVPATRPRAIPKPSVRSSAS
jgi:hypothetical protein